MATDPKEETTERRSEHRLGDLGFTRIPAEEDPRRKNPELLAAIAKIAPGTGLREAVDDVIRSHEGALIVVGDPHELSFLYSGGIQLDAPFRPQLLYELAKMDGAIIVDEAIKRLAWANVQLMPDPTIPSNETGTRHRTAERVAKQTGALVVSVSQQRETVTIFVGPARYQLDPVADVLAKTNQALGTLDTYRQRLEQVLTRLTALEFQNAVVLDDVLVVLQRAEMTSRMAARITRDCVELGTEGRLIRLQLEEFVGDVPGERDAIVRDYHVLGAGEEATVALAGSAPSSITRSCSSSGGSPRCSATSAASTRSTRPSCRAATGSSRTSRVCPSRSSAGSCPTSGASMRSSARRSASSSRSRASARCGRARSARGCAGCRSTTSWIAISSCSWTRL